MNRITTNIVQLLSGRWRASVIVDQHYEVAHAICDTYKAAHDWCVAKVAEVALEVR